MASKRGRNRKQGQRQPGFEGKYEPVNATVENPYGRKGEHETVVVNRRESTAGTLRLGPAQQRAYDHIRRLWESTGAWKNAAVDPGNEPVDTSSFPDPLPERAANAFQELRWVYRELGDDSIFLTMTIKWGLSYQEIASIKWGRTPTKHEVNETRHEVRKVFSKAAEALGYAGKPNWWSRLKAWRPYGVPGIDESRWSEGEETP